MSPVQGKAPHVQVKELYRNFDMVTCRLSSCNPVFEVHRSAGNAREGVMQYVEEERKKGLKTPTFRFDCDVYKALYWTIFFKFRTNYSSAYIKTHCCHLSQCLFLRGSCDVNL